VALEDVLLAAGLLNGLPKLCDRDRGDESGTITSWRICPVLAMGDNVGRLLSGRPWPSPVWSLGSWIGGGKEGEENVIAGVSATSRFKFRCWRRCAV
jgi:hypothetical protein